MDNMFKDAKAFNQDIFEWNTAKVKSMYSMFSGADAIHAKDTDGLKIRAFCEGDKGAADKTCYIHS